MVRYLTGNTPHPPCASPLIQVRMSVGGDADARMKNGSGLAIEYDVDNNSPTVEVKCAPQHRERSRLSRPLAHSGLNSFRTS